MSLNINLKLSLSVCLFSAIIEIIYYLSRDFLKNLINIKTIRDLIMFDFRYYIDLLLEDKQMATSILNQATIKQQEGTLTDNQFQEIKHVLEIAPAVLIKNNRLVWFFRIIKAYVNGNLNTTQLGTYRFISLVALLDKLAEYYNPNNSIESIEKYSFSNQTVSDVLAFFEQEKEKTHREQEAKQEADRGVDPQENDYILFKFQGNQTIANDGSKEFEELPFDYAWWWIDRAVCPEEGRSGHHCGNVAGQQFPDQRILSFRDNQNRVQMTFIREPDGTLGEMRANYNQKPNSKFHPYIMPLLMWDRVEGIKGAPYGSSSAFSIFDLNSQQLDYLDQNKPKLIQNQTEVTPFELLRNNISEYIKQKYLKYAAQKQPAVKRLLSDNTFNQWSNEIKINESLIIYLPEDFIPQYPNYLNLLIKHLKYNPADLLQVPRSISRNFKYLSLIVAESPTTIAATSQHVKGYDKLCKIAVEKDTWTLQFIPDNVKIQQPELCEFAVNENVKTLQFVPESIKLKNPKLCKIAVTKDGETLKFVPDSIKLKNPKLCDIAISNNGLAIAYVPDPIKIQYPELYQKAVSENGNALGLIPEDIILANPKLCAIAIRYNGDNIEFVPSELITKFIEPAFDRINPFVTEINFQEILNKIPKNERTPDIYELFLRKNGSTLKYIPIEDRSLKLCQIAVSQDRSALNYVPDKFRDELNISRAALRKITYKPSKIKSHARREFDQYFDDDDNDLDFYGFI